MYQCKICNMFFGGGTISVRKKFCPECAKARQKQRYREAHPLKPKVKKDYYMRKYGKPKDEAKTQIKIDRILTRADREWSKRKHKIEKHEKAVAWERALDRIHDRVYGAVRSGKLIRPEHCSACNKKCKPEAHHDDYEKPLEVRWLCRACHIALHKLINSTHY